MAVNRTAQRLEYHFTDYTGNVFVKTQLSILLSLDAIFLLLLETLDTLQKTKENVSLFSSYCWLQCLKQADIEQVCWETVGNINENEKAEQNVMETFGGVVVEARKRFVF